MHLFIVYEEYELQAINAPRIVTSNGVNLRFVGRI